MAGTPKLDVGAGVGPGPAVLVTAQRVDAFAAVLGAPVGAAGGPAPSTLVVALALDSPGGPVDLLRPLLDAGRVGGVVHGDQQLTVHRPIRPGDLLVFSSAVATVRRLPGATVTGITTAVAAPDGVLVADLRATFVLADPDPA